MITLALVVALALVTLGTKLPAAYAATRAEVLAQALAVEMAADVVRTLPTPAQRRIVLHAIAGGPVGVYETVHTLRRVWWVRQAAESARATAGLDRGEEPTEVRALRERLDEALVAREATR